MLKGLGFAGALALFAATSAIAEDTPGVTASEIKVGATFPFSGPASSLGVTGKGMIAYVDSINERGGIGGRKIDLITYDDGYSPPKAVEQTRKLIESDKVAFIFGSLGTPALAATIKYVNAKEVPHLFVVSGASRFANFKEYPYTTTGLPSYNTEGKIYAKYITDTAPNAKIAILYQNDDLGKDFVGAFKEYLQDDFDKKVVTSGYDVSEPTIESHILTLKSSGAEALLVAGTPKFAAQAIRKAREIGWKPLLLINFVSSSVSSTIIPAGVENAIGVVSGTLIKDPVDKKWANDPGIMAMNGKTTGQKMRRAVPALASSSFRWTFKNMQVRASRGFPKINAPIQYPSQIELPTLRHSYRTVCADLYIDDVIAHVQQGWALRNISESYLTRLVLADGQGECQSAQSAKADPWLRSDVNVRTFFCSSFTCRDRAQTM